MADDLKISDMVEILAGDLHDDLAFEVIDLLEPLVEDQNKQVKLVTLEQAFGAEDRIFKDTTIVRAWGDTDPEAVTMDMLESDSASVLRFFDAQGSLSRVDIGGMNVPGIFMRFGIGSDPTIRAMSGSDTWFFLHPDEQRLGSTAAGNAYLRVLPGSDAIQANVFDAETGVNQQVVNIDGINSRIDLGRTAALFARLGIGSDPTFRIMSGTDEWLYIHGDQQRLGGGGVSDAHVRVTSGGIEGVVSNIHYLRLQPALQVLGDNSGATAWFEVSGGDLKGYVGGLDSFRIDNTGNHRFGQASGAPKLLFNASGIADLYGNNTHYLRVDATVPEILAVIAGTTELTVNANGLALKAGATVNEIETTLTNDDTHIPTSGAVFDAIGAIATDKILEGDSSVEVVDAGTGSVITTVDASEKVRVENELFRVTLDKSPFVTDGVILQADGRLIELGRPATTAWQAYTGEGGVAYLQGVIGGTAYLNMEAGQQIIGSTGNEQIRVDQAANDIEMIVAGSVVARFLANGVLELGQEDLVFGTLYLRGQATGSTQGGKLVIDTAADYDSGIPPINYYSIEADEDDLVFTRAGTPMLKMVGPSTSWDFVNGTVAIGINDGTKGVLNVYGGATTGGTIRAYTAADSDDTIDYYNFETAGEDLNIGPNTDPDAITYKGSTGIVEFNGQEGVKLTDSSGSQAIANAASSVSVTFSGAKSSADYIVVCTVENTTDGSPLVLAAIITAKATTGFTATLSAATDSANYVLNWLIVRS